MPPPVEVCRLQRLRRAPLLDSAAEPTRRPSIIVENLDVPSLPPSPQFFLVAPIFPASKRREVATAGDFGVLPGVLRPPWQCRIAEWLSTRRNI